MGSLPKNLDCLKSRVPSCKEGGEPLSYLGMKAAKSGKTYTSLQPLSTFCRILGITFGPKTQQITYGDRTNLGKFGRCYNIVCIPQHLI